MDSDEPIHSDENFSSQSMSSGSTRQPLSQIDIKSVTPEETTDEIPDKNLSFSLVTDTDKENLSITNKKRTIGLTTTEPTCKKQKKINAKPLITGQKMITTFFQSKS